MPGPDPSPAEKARRTVEAVWRIEAPRLVGALVRMLRAARSREAAMGAAVGLAEGLEDHVVLLLGHAHERAEQARRFDAPHGLDRAARLFRQGRIGAGHRPRLQQEISCPGAR